MKLVWYCTVGPFESDKLAPHADLALQRAIRRAYYEMVSIDPKVLNTGFRMDRPTRSSDRDVAMELLRQWWHTKEEENEHRGRPLYDSEIVLSYIGRKESIRIQAKHFRALFPRGA